VVAVCSRQGLLLLLLLLLLLKCGGEYVSYLPRSLLGNTAYLLRTMFNC